MKSSYDYTFSPPTKGKPLDPAKGRIVNNILTRYHHHFVCYYKSNLNDGGREPAD